MKLVTGIEAIQSGKPFKLVPDTEWTYPSSIIGQVTPRELLEKIWVLKEEPREFWINSELTDKGCKHCGIPISSTKIIDAGNKWIRVREVEK